MFGLCNLSFEQWGRVMAIWNRYALQSIEERSHTQTWKGSLRCDINVSVNRQGEPPGTRCEVKNVNSVKFMIAAISMSRFPCSSDLLISCL